MTEILRCVDRSAVARAAADRFAHAITSDLDTADVVHVALTGGTVGILTLDMIAAHHAELPWARVHVWWGDERWLPAGNAERNDQQARDALLDRIEIPAANVHPFPAADDGLTLDAAADAATALLGQFGTEGPRFAVTFLGVGPDGHVASLFPDRPGIDEGGLAIAVRESPKPPPERLSLTRPLLNRSDRLWLVVAGDDKANAVADALASTDERTALPAARVHGTNETLWIADLAALSAHDARAN